MSFSSWLDIVKESLFLIFLVLVPIFGKRAGKFMGAKVDETVNALNDMVIAINGRVNIVELAVKRIEPLSQEVMKIQHLIEENRIRREAELKFQEERHALEETSRKENHSTLIALIMQGQSTIASQP